MEGPGLIKPQVKSTTESMITNAAETVKTATTVDPKTCAELPNPRPMAAHRLPLTALGSYPGSGNTWLRILLSSLTGKISK